MKYQPPFDPGFAGPTDGIYNSDPDAVYKNGNPSTGEEGSIPPMEALDHPMRELIALIQYAGLTPTHSDLTQVRKSIKKLIEEAVVSNPLTGDAVAIWEGLKPVTGQHKMRPLKAGANVTIDLVEEPAASGQYQIVISSSGGGGGGGGDLSLENIGGAAQVYKETVADVAKLRSIEGINGINVRQLADKISVDGAGFLGFAPIYPHMLNGDGAFTLTSSVGSVAIDNSQNFVHRGCRRINTSDTLLADRTFATLINKTYHVRWRWNDGSPSYVLKDLADSGYNPGGLGETDQAFDSTYDDMLIARVTTNASNVPTVTRLKNAAHLRQQINKSSMANSSSSWNVGNNLTTVLNWARCPFCSMTSYDVEQTGGADMVCRSTITPTRYAVVSRLDGYTTNNVSVGAAFTRSANEFVDGKYTIDCIA